jgi:hypothetical protein
LLFLSRHASPPPVLNSVQYIYGKAAAFNSPEEESLQAKTAPKNNPEKRILAE